MFRLSGNILFAWLSFFILIVTVSDLYAVAVPDTSKVYKIDEVTVTSAVRNHSITSTAPLHMLSSDQIGKLNVIQVAEAVKFFPGVTVRDYGGIGGLKTVSVRSLGASHTAVSYDGITITDVQTGQIDIGRFSLENVEMISLNNGQSDNIFQPARLFASASLLNIRTKTPTFDDGHTYNASVSLKGGSFGLFNPAFLYQQQLGSKTALSVSGEWLSSHGQYPYLLEYSYLGDGETSIEKRKNTDVQNFRLEGALYHQPSDSENLQLRVYYYDSERGLPGATILYNTDNFSSQRLWDQTFFSQAWYEKRFSQQWSAQLNAKYNYGKLRYLDTTYHNSIGRMESIYRQQEYYLSAAMLFRPTANWSFSLASDGFSNHMDAEFETPALTDEFARPSRYSLLTVLAAKYISEQFTATSSLLSTLVKDEVQTGNAGASHRKWSPYLSFSWQPLKEHDLRLRAFYKHIFRLPSFNDLYYARIGNANLKPETTHQWNGGITWSVQPGAVVPIFTITADAYKNRVMDKIVAMPTKNIFVWSMTNLGIVDITGFDFTAESAVRISEDVTLSLMGAYTYQKAIDVTNPQGGSYGHQIPYTPRVSGSGRAALETPFLSVAYAFLWSGKRYAGYQNFAENRLPGYADHSLSAYRTFDINGRQLTAKAEVLNLLDEQYAVVKWFPMPGRSYRITCSIKL